jgi:hypothetical protein
MVCGVTAAALALPSAADADQLFAPGSYRNTPLAANAPLSPMSSSYVLDLAGKVNSHGAHVNVTSYGVPIYTVPDGQATTRVHVANAGHPDRLDCKDAAGNNAYGAPLCLAKQWEAVPLPAGATPSSGTDGSLVVYQPSKNTLWEFWKYRLDEITGQPTAEFGGRLENVHTNPGHFTDPPGNRFGAAATKIPHLVGTIRISEFQADAINHVVSFVMKDPGKPFVWPAQNSDGTNQLATVAPEGSCFRLPASLNLTTLGLTKPGYTIARAVQKYGMVMTDSAGVGIVNDRPGVGVAFAGETSTSGPDPYHGPGTIFGSLDENSTGANGVLRNFPWSQLQALRAGTC